MYDRTFGTDWETIDSRDEAIRRAYALGVATRLGASHPDELERLNAQTETTYDRSFVELAYQKGRDEAAAATADEVGAVWETLVGDKTEIDPFDRDEDVEWEEPNAESTLPDALGLIDIDTLPDDSTERVRRPSFLDRESDSHPAADGDEERTVFGRPVSDVRSPDNDSNTPGTTDEGPDDANRTDSGATSDDHSPTEQSPTSDSTVGNEGRTDSSDSSASETDREE